MLRWRRAVVNACIGCFSESSANFSASTDFPEASARATICFSTSCVSTQPGQIALQVMPRLAVSKATTFVSPTMPCFDATYADLVGARDERVRGRDVDDAPPLPRLHAGESGTNRVKCRRKVDRNDRIPLLDGEIFNWRDVLDARVVHEYVERAEALLRIADHCGDCVGFRHIRWRIGDLDLKFPFERLALRFDRTCVAEFVERDIGAGLGESPRGCRANAARRTGDEGRFPVEQRGAPANRMWDCAVQHRSTGSAAQERPPRQDRAQVTGLLWSSRWPPRAQVVLSTRAPSSGRRSQVRRNVFSGRFPRPGIRTCGRTSRRSRGDPICVRTRSTPRARISTSRALWSCSPTSEPSQAGATARLAVSAVRNGCWQAGRTPTGGRHADSCSGSRVPLDHFRLGEIGKLHHPVATEEDMPRHNSVTYDEGTEFSVDALRVRCFAKLDPDQVAHCAAQPSVTANSSFKFVRAVHHRKRVMLGSKFSADDDRKARGTFAIVQSVDVELVDPPLVQGAQEIKPVQHVSRTVQHPVRCVGLNETIVQGDRCCAGWLAHRTAGGPSEDIARTVRNFRLAGYERFVVDGCYPTGYGSAPRL